MLHRWTAVMLPAAILWTASCGDSQAPTGHGGSGTTSSPHGGEAGASTSSSSTSATSASSAASSSGAAPDCGACGGCCTADGQCVSGGSDSACGFDGSACVDCTPTGDWCRYDGVTFRCLAIKQIGEARSSDGECINNDCGPSGTCEVTCKNAGETCWGNGGDKCCEAGTSCDMSSPGAPPGICCYAVGTKLADIGQCAHCCPHDGLSGACTQTAMGWLCQ